LVGVKQMRLDGTGEGKIAQQLAVAVEV